jgi:hypothetical protein
VSNFLPLDKWKENDNELSIFLGHSIPSNHNETITVSNCSVLSFLFAGKFPHLWAETSVFFLTYYNTLILIAAMNNSFSLRRLANPGRSVPRNPHQCSVRQVAKLSSCNGCVRSRE